MGAAPRKIGLITSLYYYLITPYWKALFEGLGFEVVLGGGSRQELPAQVHRFENELCLPVKYFLAQAGELSAQGVDFVFAPLVYSLQKGTFACPKIIMTPDLIRLYFPNLEGLLSPALFVHYDAGRYRNFANTAVGLAEPLGIPLAEISAAAYAAETVHKQFEQDLRGSHLLHDELDALASASGAPDSASVSQPAPGALRVLVLGHRYTVHNAVLANDVVEELRRLDFAPVSKEHLPSYGLGVNALRETGIDADVFMSEGADIFRAAFYGARDPGVDAVIYLAMFNCGFDAVLEDVVAKRILKAVDKPYLHLVIDEHATKSNLVTRLEVFHDVVAARKQARLAS